MTASLTPFPGRAAPHLRWLAVVAPRSGDRPAGAAPAAPAVLRPASSTRCRPKAHAASALFVDEGGLDLLECEIVWVRGAVASFVGSVSGGLSRLCRLFGGVLLFRVRLAGGCETGSGARGRGACGFGEAAASSSLVRQTTVVRGDEGRSRTAAPPWISLRRPTCGSARWRRHGRVGVGGDELLDPAGEVVFACGEQLDLIGDRGRQAGRCQCAEINTGVRTGRKRWQSFVRLLTAIRDAFLATVEEELM